VAPCGANPKTKSGAVMSYRASASKGARPSGQSAAAKHRYHHRDGLYAEGRDGPREDLAASGFGNLPAWAGDDPAVFWLATDSYERANGTLFRELQLNLPHELTLQQQQHAVKQYASLMFDAERLPYSWVIHREPGERNAHAHVMVSETMTDDHERTAEQHFRRFNPRRPEAGGARKTRSLKPKSWLMDARAGWAVSANAALVAAGHEPRFDHRSKEVQRDEALRQGNLRKAAMLDTPTQQHEGPRIAGMRRRWESGETDFADLPQYAQDVIEANNLARELGQQWQAAVELMSDAELAEHYADELAELQEQLAQENPGAHVAAWQAEQQRQRDQAELGELVAAEAERQAAELRHLGAVQAAHAEALAEAAERDAELAELVAGEGEQQAADLGHLGAVQAAHAEALIEAAERDAELAQLVAGEQARHAADLEMLADWQALERHDARVAQARERLASLPERVPAPAPTPQERRADQLEQARADWLQAHPVRARLGLVPAAVSQDTIDRARREADRARAAAVAAADERQRQIDQRRAQMTAWLERAEQYRRQHWPGEYPPPAAPEPPQVAQEPLGRVETLRDSLQALQTAVEHHQPEWVVWEEHGYTLGGWDGEDVTYLYDAQADGWEQVQPEPTPRALELLQEPDPDDTPAPRGPRMR